jgi:predicted O-methyltransferase YrrM
MTLKIETENHCHVEEEKGYLFKSEDTQSTEDEYLHLLYALVYALKPRRILETGCFMGMGTAFMAKALKRNSEFQDFIPHKGLIVSVEIQPKAVEWAREQLRVNAVSDYGLVVCMDSMEFLAEVTGTFDFAFFDSQLHLRAKELQICLDRGILSSGAFFAMHDTSRLRTITPGQHDPESDKMWIELEKIEGIKFLEFPLSRGLVLGQVI